MPEACLSVLSTDACEWRLEGIWRSSDVVLRGIFLGLALMLAYTLFFVIRFSRRYHLARRRNHDFKSDGLPNFSRSNSVLLADLSPGLGVLRGIATAAPFLGLAGTCYGFLAGLSIPFSGSPASALAFMVRMVAAAPATTIAGILVAIPAASFHSLVRAALRLVAVNFCQGGTATSMILDHFISPGRCL